MWYVTQYWALANAEPGHPDILFCPASCAVSGKANTPSAVSSALSTTDVKQGKQNYQQQLLVQPSRPYRFPLWRQCGCCVTLGFLIVATKFACPRRMASLWPDPLSTWGLFAGCSWRAMNLFLSLNWNVKRSFSWEKVAERQMTKGFPDNCSICSNKTVARLLFTQFLHARL